MNILLKVLPKAANLLPFNVKISLVDKYIDFMLKKYATMNILNKEVVKERKGKPTIYIGNHLSNVDGVILNKILKDNNIAFLAGVKLQDNPLTKMVMDTINTIPITPNTADKEAIKNALDHLKSNGSIFIFPEGTRSRSGKMINARSGFILLCKLSGAEIVPVALEGTEKLLPVNDSSMGKEEMHHAEVKVVFGKPFNLLEKNKANKSDWTELAKNHAMGKIADLLDESYRGVYGSQNED